MSGAPAIAANVGSQSWCETMPLTVTPAGKCPEADGQDDHVEKKRHGLGREIVLPDPVRQRIEPGAEPDETEIGRCRAHQEKYRADEKRFKDDGTP